MAGLAGLTSAVILLLLLSTVTVTQAAGLVDDTVDSANLYSLYPLDHYQLDFYVDDSWDWLPWNWNDGIGKQVMYGLYTITNFIWIINLYLANATGYLVQQAYSLDFISDTAHAIGQNMQTLAGITAQGFGADGFYVGFLLLFILFVGMYVTYTGLLKRETTKAVRAMLNFVLIFTVSAAFIAFAPTYITKINDFSADVSEASLDLGTQIVMPGSETQGENSVDMIRNTLFSIQVEQPWLLLQFDDSDKAEIGEERVDALVSIDPNANNGADREAAVQTEIEEHDNMNLTITKTTTRLGMVVFLSLFNLGISTFIFLLTGIMIFSQILFIIFAMFLPISFLLSMLPTFEGMAKQAILKLFNIIMLRAGITLIITVAFSLSSMIYGLTAAYPFFLIAFLQIVTFAGIYMKLGDILGMFRLQSSDSQQVGRKVMRRPQQMAQRSGRKIQRTITRTLVGATTGAGTGALIGRFVGQSKHKKQSPIASQPLRQTMPSQKQPKSTDKPTPTAVIQKRGRTTEKAAATQPGIRGSIQHHKQQKHHVSRPTKYVLAPGHTQLKHSKRGVKPGGEQTKLERQNVSSNRKQTQHSQPKIKNQRSLQQKPRQNQTINKQSDFLSKRKINRTQNRSVPPQQVAMFTNKPQRQTNPVRHSQPQLSMPTQLKKEKRTLYRQLKPTESHRPYHPATERAPSQAKRTQQKQQNPVPERKVPKHRMKRPLYPGRRERR
ncbi:ABC transporter permease [Jeotgalicoccus sp. S0W5]|uniref:ABC transporter permease n=1 Tax=Jeotgalicoccus sp. S0W5 TaxID=2527874 RepID=UPI001F0D3E4C|nr:ABC transporter permease [Jeotgalicoccus sp. S0W5]